MNRTSSLLLATALLVGGANIGAYAATGDPLLAGKANATAKLTALQRTMPGPALKLSSKPGSPPLAVTSTTKVARLNADRVDNLEAKALQTASVVYALPAVETTTSVDFAFPSLPPGSYLVSFDVQASNTSGNLVCLLLSQTSTYPILMGSTAPASQAYSGASATAVIQIPAGSVKLQCYSGGGGTFDLDPTFTRSTVSFTRVDQTTSRAAVVLPAPTPGRATDKR